VGSESTYMYGIGNGGGYISDTGIYRRVTVMGRLLQLLTRQDLA